MSGLVSRKSALWKRLYEQVCKTRIVDCHMHTYTQREYANTATKPGIFTIFSYFQREIDGIEEVHGLKLSACKTDEERWKVLKQILDLAGNVTFWRHIWQVYRELYGLGNVELNDSNWRTIHRKMQNHAKRPGWYRRLFKEIAGLDLGVYSAPMTNVKSALSPKVTVPRSVNDDYFVSSVHIAELITITNRNPLLALEKECGIAIRNAASLVDAIESFFHLIKSEGAVAIKSPHAYERTLLHEQVSPATASRLLSKLLRKGGKPSAAELRKLQDFIFWTVCEKAGEIGLVFQMHTGIQTTWSWMPDSDPRHLMKPIGHFRNTKFDLFHAGYPFTMELGLMAKHYPNIWANMAWMYVVTMEGSRRTLDEWIDLIPAHRIMGFGSDVAWPEEMIGHVSMARLCIADVLAKKVTMDLLTEERAVRLIQQLLRENAISLYGLESNPLLSTKKSKTKKQKAKSCSGKRM